MATLLLVFYANGALVAHADDSQQPVDCGSGVYYDCGQTVAQPAPVVVLNDATAYPGENSTYYG